MTTENGVATTAMVVQRERYDGLVMVVSPVEARRRMQELQAFVQEVMVQGTDFGLIPGTEKPSLFQPGAQKLAELYGFAHDFLDVVSTEDWDKPFFFYRRKCVLSSRRDGSFVGSGIGSCNSREDRYATRWSFDNEVPSGVDKKSLRKKTITGRNNKQYTKYAVPNQDICSLVNTIEKMACKRAYIHAVIAVSRSAGIFTHDVEDLPDAAYGQEASTRSWEHGSGPGPAKAAPPAPETPKPVASAVDLDALYAGFEKQIDAARKARSMPDLKAVSTMIAGSSLDKERRQALFDVYDFAANEIETAAS